VPGQNNACWLSDSFLNEVSQFDINGRQIKNALRVAHSLAMNQKRELASEDIMSVLQAVAAFDDNSNPSEICDTGRRKPADTQRTWAVWGWQLIRSLLRF
jgi:phage FluMu protein gp41